MNPYQTPADSDDSASSPVGAVVHAVIDVTPAFTLDSLRRYRKQRRYSREWTIFRLLGAGLFLLCAIVGLLIPNWFVSVFGFTFFLASVFAHKLDEFFVLRKFRKSPHYGKTVEICISEVHYHTVSELHDAKLTWASFTDWANFDDGVLILQGPQVFHWIPTSSLSGMGDLDLLRSLLVSKMGER